MRFFYVSIITLFFSYAVWGQSSNLPLGSDTYHLLDRWDIKYELTPEFHSSIKPYLRGDAVNFAQQVFNENPQLTKIDLENLYHLFDDNNEVLTSQNNNLSRQDSLYNKKIYVDSSHTFYYVETEIENQEVSPNQVRKSNKPFLKHFYKTPANFWELNTKDFYLRLNPILNAKVFLAEDDDFLFFNQRGIRIRGGIDNKVFFSTEILESQARFANYVREQIQEERAIPGAGFYKTYNSSVVDVKDAHDFLLAQGYVGLNVSKHVFLQLGHGRNFIGSGYRSLFLSDYGNNYFYLKLNARIWKFHYQTIFSELNAAGARDDRGDLLIPKKYAAMHYLTFRPTSNFSVGFFEAVIFNRNNDFELQYLNPVIFYRTIEQAVGSSDNALLGFDFKWNLFKRFQAYGQLILDEFKFKEMITDQRGWWGNKNGVQLGIKYIDMLGLAHLDGQVEFNTVRPYTYTHRDSSAAYTHYNQELAHPLGANFKEIIFKLRYPITQKIIFQPRLIYATVGEDIEGQNWGSDLLKPHVTRQADYGNETGQGIDTKIMIAALDLSYEWKHNFFIDLHYFYRNKNSKLDALDLKTSYVGGGIRWNFWNRNLDF